MRQRLTPGGGGGRLSGGGTLQGGVVLHAQHIVVVNVETSKHAGGGVVKACYKC